MVPKPPLFEKGDKIGIVAPGGAFNREKFKAGVAYLRSLGLVPVFAPSLFKKDIIFAGTVRDRVRSLKKMLGRKDLKGLWCVRGGYGTYAVAQELGRLRRPKTPKVILGQSDILALHLICMQNWKWPVLHSPLLDRIGTDRASPRERRVLEETLLNEKYRLHLSGNGLKALGRKAEVTGSLTGGNLAMAASSLKTEWEIQTDHKIFFLEEIGERAYRIDRFLFQLEAAGKFDKVKAVVLGDFTECNEPDGKPIWKEIIRRHFANAKFPVLWGVRAGHGDLRLTLPMNVRVRVKTSGKPSFEVLESYARGRGSV